MLYILLLLALVIVFLFLYLLSWIAIKINKRKFWFNKLVRQINGIRTIGAGRCEARTYIDENGNYLTCDQVSIIETRFLNKLKSGIGTALIPLAVLLIGLVKYTLVRII